MLGYDISWAAFNIIEVMSSSRFTYKVLISLFYLLSAIETLLYSVSIVELLIIDSFKGSCIDFGFSLK